MTEFMLDVVGGRIRQIKLSRVKQLPDTALTSPGPPDQSIGTLRHLVFLFLCVASLAIWWKPCLTTVDLALKTPEYSHILIIVPISAVLAFLRRRTLRGLATLDFAMGIPLLLLSLVAGLWSSWTSFKVPDVELFVSMLALVMWWIGSIVLCFGRRVLGLLLFPILFLFLVVPWPEFVLSRVVGLLQQASASLTYLMFQMVGVPVGKSGVILSIPGLDIEVAKECSSIRSSVILVITSMVLGYLFLCSAWRKVLVTLVAIPLSIAKNAVRIFTLSLLATHVDPGFLAGRLHKQGGIVFFTLSVLALWVLIRMLQHRSRVGATGSASHQQFAEKL
jgi:exosortase